VINETDITLSDGRALHVYDAPPDGGDARLTVFWHHGTPNTGAPPEPLFPAAARRGIRWVSCDRPAYGGSSPHRGREVGSVAADVAAAADALGIGRFAVMGHSGGGPHALACGALLPDRVLAVVSGSGLAPFDADGLDWFAGMAPSGEAELRAAAQGREALERQLAAGEFDQEIFTPQDWAALEGPWAWLAGIAGDAMKAGPEGMVEDDLAYVSPWGFDPAQVQAPLLILHGGQDRCVPPGHGEWLARYCPTAEFRPYPADGHVSLLNSAEDALDWLHQRAAAG
jgi:pimeloyl-ACP methyl ester carboxylesterase